MTFGVSLHSFIPKVLINVLLLNEKKRKKKDSRHFLSFFNFFLFTSSMYLVEKMKILSPATLPILSWSLLDRDMHHMQRNTHTKCI